MPLSARDQRSHRHLGLGLSVKERKRSGRLRRVSSYRPVRSMSCYCHYYPPSLDRRPGPTRIYSFMKLRKYNSNNPLSFRLQFKVSCLNAGRTRGELKGFEFGTRYSATSVPAGSAAHSGAEVV